MLRDDQVQYVEEEHECVEHWILLLDLPLFSPSRERIQMSYARLDHEERKIMKAHREDSKGIVVPYPGVPPNKEMQGTALHWWVGEGLVGEAENGHLSKVRLPSGKVGCRQQRVKGVSVGQVAMVRHGRGEEKV